MSLPKIFSVAPMMDCTDKHDRYFLRLIAPDIHLYTEMITTHAIKHGDRDYLLGFHPQEKYVALQLGGCDPQDLSDCAQIGEDYGYDEINLNVGCPSSRVKAGKFGACLMLEPELVADCVNAMQAKVNIPITVKCRIGVDNYDSFQHLCDFIHSVSLAGCKTFMIHARKAWLSGLSPKENREIPPLQYNMVYQVKEKFPHLNIILNGGIKTLADIHAVISHVDGVMIGRAAYSNPYFLAQIQAHYFSRNIILTRPEVVYAFLPYISDQMTKGLKLHNMTRHMLGLFNGEKGASAWRRYLSQNAYKTNAGIEVIKEALYLQPRGLHDNTNDKIF